VKILVAPNAFKDTLSSIEVAKHIAKGLKKASRKFAVVKTPLADGGIGTVQIITQAFDGKFVRKKVTGPLGTPVYARYGLISSQRVAIIELAEAAGVHLIPEKKRNPCATSTTGVGELIADAVKRKYRKILLGIGDSATIDCGTGALSVLGVRFLDHKNNEIIHTCNGLCALRHIDTSHLNEEYRRCKVTIASDVKNVLTGKYGARFYARQKGAPPDDMAKIDKALRTFRLVVKQDCHVDLDKIPGSGAAGGVGGAFAALLGAQILSGSGLVQGMVCLEEEIKSSDIVITGEGKIDKASFYGKTLKRVIDIAYIHKKPVMLIAGTIAKDVFLKKKYHVMGEYSLSVISGSVRKAMKNTAELLERIAFSIGNDLKAR
jgi:glycerate kinase